MAKVVTVFGANDAIPGSEAYQRARDAGATLAALGYAVANGGYGGTMEASARGAKEAGGRTIGVTCRPFGCSANTWIDETIVAEDIYGRAARLIELGTGGYVVLPGATGTLVELSLAWEQMRKGLLARRPLVCMGFWRPVIEMMSSRRPGSERTVTVVESVGELARHFPRQGAP